MFNKPKVIMHRRVRVSDNKLLKNTKSENKNIEKLQCNNYFWIDELQIRGFNLFKSSTFENIHYGSRQESGITGKQSI